MRSRLECVSKSTSETILKAILIADIDGAYLAEDLARAVEGIEKLYLHCDNRMDI